MVVPIYKESERDTVTAAVNDIVKTLSPSVRVRADLRDGLRPGFKFNEWEMKGVPLRLEVGPRDLAAGQVTVARRVAHEGVAAKQTVALASLAEAIPPLLEEIQRDLYDVASRRLHDNIRPVDGYEQFKQVLEEKGGFLLAYWCGSAACEAQVKEETKATIRCIPLEATPPGPCLLCGSQGRHAYFARAY